MKRFNDRIQQLPFSVLSSVARVDGLNGQWIGGAQLSPQALNRLKRSVLVTSAGASTRIEGAKLSDSQVEKLMRGLSPQKLKDRDEQEVQGYYEVLQTVFESWQHIHFSENIIKQLHAELLAYATKDKRHRGDYKKLENSVEMKDAGGRVIQVLFETTPAYLVPKEMSELVAWTRAALGAKNYHPLLVIANFVVEFLKIHPFLDGNGRLSRVLTNLLMLQAGYEYIPYVSLEKLIEDAKADYYVALRQSQASFATAHGSIAPWANFFIGVAQTQARQAIGLLSGEALERLLSPNQLLVWQYLLTVEEASIQGITQATGVARPTVRQAMGRLLQLKRIERLGLGRTTRYRKV